MKPKASKASHPLIEKERESKAGLQGEFQVHLTSYRSNTFFEEH